MSGNKNDQPTVSPFEFVNAVSTTKEHLLNNQTHNEEDYNCWLTNKSFSYYPETVLHANEMNRLPNLDNALQFDYYFHAIPRKRRFSKWVKYQKEPIIDHICVLYNCNKYVAEQYLRIMSESDKQYILQSMKENKKNE